VLVTGVQTCALPIYPGHSTILKINAVMEARTNILGNAAPLVTCEALMCKLAMN